MQGCFSFNLPGTQGWAVEPLLTQVDPLDPKSSPVQLSTQPATPWLDGMQSGPEGGNCWCGQKMNSAVTITATNWQPTIFNHLGMPSGAAKSSYGFPLRDPQRPAVRPQRGPSAVIRNMSWEIFRFVCVLQYKCIFRTLTEDYYYLIINRR